MSWQQLIFSCDSRYSDQISNLLSQSGAGSVTMLDAGDSPIFEPPLNTTPLWPEVILNGLFPADKNLEPILKLISQVLDKTPDYKIEILEDKDWIREWMDNYQPIKLGKNLWICPSWLEPPEPDAVNIMLDPGLAFGTGTHATTALCLKWLDEHVLNIQPKQMLDFGCGSGILAVAGLKLGIKQVYALDIYSQAIEATQTNAEKNDCKSGLICLIAQQFEQQYASLQVDLLVANILARPLIELSALLKSKVKPGGLIALSGILANQADKVLAAYEDEFDFDAVVQEDDWVRLSGKKRNSNSY